MSIYYAPGAFGKYSPCLFHLNFTNLMEYVGPFSILLFEDWEKTLRFRQLNKLLKVRAID
jgi:hypothetical protein